jgi:hypothetical protein
VRSGLFAKDAARVLDPRFVGDAGFGQPHELGEWPSSREMIAAARRPLQEDESARRC